jgi:hypothetical protein
VVPNAVTVAMPTVGPYAGQIDITYDAYGATGPTTDILIDVVGYTTSESLDAIALAMPFAMSARVDEQWLNYNPISVVFVWLQGPYDGHVTVNTSTTVFHGDVHTSALTR